MRVAQNVLPLLGSVGVLLMGRWSYYCKHCNAQVQGVVDRGGLRSSASSPSRVPPIQTKC